VLPAFSDQLQTVKTKKNLDNGIKRMGYKSCQESHATVKTKNLDNGKRISAARQGSKTTEDGRKTALQSKRTKVTGIRIYKYPRSPTVRYSATGQ
jgi:hypothetical protein